MHIKINHLNVLLGEREVITGLNLEIPSGTSVAIVGKSGVGKTTLLRVIAGLITPDAGRVLIDGAVPESFFGSAKLAYLFQRAHLWQHLTVRNNLRLIYELHGRAVDETHIDLQLEAVDLSDAQQLHPFQLSAGMKARAAIARVLCLPPQVLLMDEPFAQLDPIRRLDLNRLIHRTCQQIGATTVWVTHDVSEALMFADRIVAVTAPRNIAIFDTTELPHIEDAGDLPGAVRDLRDRIIAACWGKTEEAASRSTE